MSSLIIEILRIFEFVDEIWMLEAVTYGERFKELREKLGLEQPDLAERLFGSRRRQPGISAIESTAGRIPRPDTIKDHAAALECQISDLVLAVNDTWIDRARRKEFDVTDLDMPAVRRHRTGS
jgi:transcriptional regulator with XRE-family HTH domain